MSQHFVFNYSVYFLCVLLKSFSHLLQVSEDAKETGESGIYTHIVPPYPLEVYVIGIKLQKSFESMHDVWSIHILEQVKAFYLYKCLHSKLSITDPIIYWTGVCVNCL